MKTIAAEAKEYRETLALEATLKADPTKAAAWLRHDEEVDEIPAMDVVEEDEESTAKA